MSSTKKEQGKKVRKGLSESLIARVLGAPPKWTIAELEKKFPPRHAAVTDISVISDNPVKLKKHFAPGGLPDGAMVTRVAPSPTGFMHLGTIYQAILDKKLAMQSGGVFVMRIEDTDTAREVPGALDIIMKCMREFGLTPNEGLEGGGAYGPYFQSERKDIYHSVAAELLEKGFAYPCFLSPDEMDEIRERQKAAGFPTGIYGEWARDRDLAEQEIAAKLDAGWVPSVRLYSTGDKSRRIFCKDAVRGGVECPENEEDIVIIKSTDGLPTYHFAHLVDDHFMRTTHVVRDASYLSTFSLHIQMFKTIGWTPPIYIHTSTLDKIDEETGGQRKLSKRKDPEASAVRFLEEGWPPEAVLEYLFNIINSSYEEDRAKGKVKNIWDAELKIKKMPTSGALFDMKKLEWWAKEFIAALPVGELVRRATDWANEYGNDFNKKEIADVDYLRRILSIERDNPKQIRKDFITWKQTLEEIAYFFDDFGAQVSDLKPNKDVLVKFLESFDSKDQKDLWWQKIQNIAAELGIKNGDAAMALRVALTGRTNTPDLYSIMQVMGAERVRERISKAGLRTEERKTK